MANSVSQNYNFLTNFGQNVQAQGFSLCACSASKSTTGGFHRICKTFCVDQKKVSAPIDFGLL